MELDNSGLDKTGEMESPVESAHSSSALPAEEAMTNTEIPADAENPTPSTAETVELPALEDMDEVTESPVATQDATAIDAEAAAPEAENAAEAVAETAAPETASAAEAATEAAAPEAENAVEAAAETPATTETITIESPFKRGDLVDATITSTSPLQVAVDLGEGVQGIITSHELEKMTRQALEALKPGESIKVFVVNPRDPSGNAVVSLNRAIEEMDWQRAEEFRQSQAPYETRVAGYNKGGLIVRFGRVRGFVPQSQLNPERRRGEDEETPEQRWGKMVNEAITVKVMEVDRSRNRLILSERMAAREAREKRKEALVNELTVGEVRTGRVVSLEDFGAFVDVGGAEGLVHLTEVTWQHITHPREVLKVGQEVAVEVISIDREQKRIGLSMKRQSPDPWDTIAIDYEIGQLVQGTVTKLTKFGAFVQLVDVPEIEGLVHISELSDRRVNTPREVVQEGDKLTLRVVKIDVKERRLGLSLKKVNSAEYLDRDMERNWDTTNDN
ncbi:MAG: S1 RNA-binding domain-containing protein [Anaerolineae bacterium]|nr:S1 RNA-binding domain-containing protein [Anaerolineae bacterium]